MPPGAGYIAVSWCCITLTLPMVLNRFYVRYMRHNGGFGKVWSWGDILVFLAWIFNVVQTSCDTLLYRAGALREDRSGLSAEQNIYIYKVFFAENMIFWVPLYLIKGAILCFYLEITPPVLRKIRISIWVAVGLICFGVVYTEINWLFVCRPISRNWDETGGAVCKDSFTVSIMIAVHMISDIYIYAIPFSLLTKIDMQTTSKKISTVLMFASGFILVLLSVPNFISYILPDIFYSADWRWVFWMGISEQTFAVVVACLPSLKSSLSMFLRDGTVGRDARRRKRSAAEQGRSGRSGADMSTRVIRERIHESIGRASKNARSLQLHSNDGSDKLGGGHGDVSPSYLSSPNLSPGFRKESQERLEGYNTDIERGDSISEGGLERGRQGSLEK